MDSKEHTKLKRLCLNEDNGHFYSRRRPDELTKSGIAALVDSYSNQTQVGQILFCVNVRRALFDSKVWDPIFKGYNPDGPDDQPMFQWLPEDQRRLDTPNQGRRQVHNIWLMTQKGLDHFAIWLQRCREKAVEGWLSIRMNDCHNAPNEQSHWHSEFWKQNPDCRIVTYREPIAWPEYSLDFSKAKVQEYYLAFVQELFERYDMDGLELDWMRFGFCLPYGQAKAKRHVITEFVRQVRELSQICAARTGKPVKLGVRVPADIQSCLSLGYDVIEWINKHLVQQITISGFLSDHWLDFPVETWQAVIDNRPIALAVCVHAGITDPASNTWLLDSAAVYRGSAGAALVKGADKVYLFNTCYYEHDNQLHRDAMLQEILTTCGSLKTIVGQDRRHILTFRQFAAPGEADQRKIPVPLKRRVLDLGSRIGQAIVLQFNIGPACAANESVFLHLGFDCAAVREQTGQLGEVLRDAGCWLNGTPCQPANDAITPQFITEEAEVVFSWTLPSEALYAGENIIEYAAPETEGNVVWAEIEIKNSSYC